MKSILKLSGIVLLFALAPFAQSQSVNKITVQDALHPFFYAITADDIAYCGPDNPTNTGANKLIGYRYRRPDANVIMGVLGVRQDNSIQFSKTYVYTIAPTNVFEIAKIAPISDFGIPNMTYALAGAGNGGTLVYPVIIQLDVTTGNIVSQLLLNGFTIPDANFVPCDLNVFYGNAFNPTIIKILCLGRSPGAVAPNPKASIYLIDLNITTNSYTVTRLIDNSSLNAYYEFPFNFVKTYHHGTFMYGETSFYGLETTLSGTNRGIVYNKDFSASPLCKAFILNNNSTANIQVNVPELSGLNDQVIALQNNSQDIYIEKNNFLSTINYQNYYRKNFSAPFYLRGTSHGSKQQSAILHTDFFLGQYQQPGLPLSGYSFFRYNYQSGAPYQTYNYDLNVDFFSTSPTPPSAYVNDDEGKYHFIGSSIPLTFQTQQYFYLVENDLDLDQTTCVNVPAFNTLNLPVARQDVSFTTSTIASNLTPSNISITGVIAPSPLIQSICNDAGSFDGGSTDPPGSGDITLGQILSSGGSGGGGCSVCKGNISLKADELKGFVQDNLLRIELGSKKLLRVNIYNTTGQLIKEIKNNKPVIDLSFNNTGSSSVYFVEAFFTDGSRATKKIYY